MFKVFLKNKGCFLTFVWERISFKCMWVCLIDISKEICLHILINMHVYKLNNITKTSKINFQIIFLCIKINIEYIIIFFLYISDIQEIDHTLLTSDRPQPGIGDKHLN